jgi:hypothetical protein
MKRIKLVGKTLPKIKLPDPNVQRIDPVEFARSIGAVPGESPLLVRVRRELDENLRSRGGRPGIEGAELRPKIPMSERDWNRLEALAHELATEHATPTPGQVASRLLHDALDRCEASPSPAPMTVAQSTRAGEARVPYQTKTSPRRDHQAARLRGLVAAQDRSETEKQAA